MSRLTVSSSPHIRTAKNTRSIMLDVIIAMLPTAIAGSVIFGWHAALLLVISCVSAVAAEAIFNLIVKKEQTVGDLSAVVTGLLVGLNVHAGTKVWQVALGSVFAIVVVKCLFGGLGCNFANPAITARIFMIICFSGAVSGGVLPIFGSESGELVTGATPLSLIASGNTGALPSLFDMFIGMRSGAIGEVCGAAIILGFVYLVVRGVIKWEVPVIFVGTVFALSLIITNSFILALYSVLGGGLLIGAVFMATDYVTTPITRVGKWIFAFGAGLITVLIRFYGSYPEGVSFAILFMNILSPYIEKWTAKMPLGGKK